MRNKDKTKKFTSQTFFPGFTPSFPSPSSPPCDDRGNGACSQCTQFLSAAPFCSQFFPAPACGPSHGIVLHKLFQHGPFPRGTILQEQIAAAGVPHRSYLLLQRGLSTGCRAVPVAFPHSSLTVALQRFLPFLKYIPTEVPPAPLLGSALASRGAARASSKWLCPAQGKPWSILREATPAVAPATKTLAPAPNTRF